MAAPSEVEAGIVLRRRIDTSRIIVPVNDNSGSSIDVCFYRRTVQCQTVATIQTIRKYLHCLPSIRREEQMDDMIFLFTLTL